MPDPTPHICFSSVFPKKAWIILCKTTPDPIWMAWSGFGQTHLVWKQAGVQESSGPVSGRMQLARYQIPTFRLSSVLPDILDNIVRNQPRSDLVLADCVRFWPNGSSPEASQYARIIRPTFGQSDLSCLLGKQLFWVGSRSVLSLFKQHKYLDFLCVCDPRSIKF